MKFILMAFAPLSMVIMSITSKLTEIVELCTKLVQLGVTIGVSVLLLKSSSIGRVIGALVSMLAKLVKGSPVGPT